MWYKKVIFTLRQPFVTNTPALTAVGGARFLNMSMSLFHSFPVSRAILNAGLILWQLRPWKHTHTHSPVAVEWQRRWSDRDEYSPSAARKRGQREFCWALIAQLGHCIQSGFGGRPVRAVQAFPAGRDAADSLALRPSQSERIGCQLHLAGQTLVVLHANLSAWAFPTRASTSIACPPNLGRGTAREAD